MATRDDSRRFERTLEPLVRRADGLVTLHAPRPGALRDAPKKGRILVPGERCGVLDELGVRTALFVPAGVTGLVVGVNPHERLAQKPVGYGDLIATLDPSATSSASAGGPTASEDAAAGLVFQTPLGGRYYSRSSPDAPPFVEVGAVIEAGQSVALIEVMKTFNRVNYGAAGLPPRARVTALLVRDGDDVNAGDAIFAIEPA